MQASSQRPKVHVSAEKTVSASKATKPQPVSGAGCCCANTARADTPPQAAITPIASGLRRNLQATTIWLPATDSFTGTDSPMIPSDGEGPRVPTRIDAFGLDATAVTNQLFADFVAATGYVTDAERFGWSFVFHLSLRHPNHHPAPVGTPWWRAVRGAAWHSPEGPGSTIKKRKDHPVTHVSWADAAAFAAWAGARLPTEAEWERAARGTASDPRYPWGNQEPDDTRILCNIWQGRFPDVNTGADGWLATAPVKSFGASELGFYNLVGNVWEWCADRFRVHEPSPAGRARDAAALSEDERTQKGGSYLCHASYCHRYRIAARTGRSADTSAAHTGFRLAWDISAKA